MDKNTFIICFLRIIIYLTFKKLLTVIGRWILSKYFPERVNNLFRRNEPVIRTELNISVHNTSNNLTEVEKLLRDQENVYTVIDKWQNSRGFTNLVTNNSTGNIISVEEIILRINEMNGLFYDVIEKINLNGVTEMTNNGNTQGFQHHNRCVNCKEFGHVLQNCTKGDMRICYNCLEIGHLARNCPKINTNRPQEIVPEISSDRETIPSQEYEEISQTSDDIDVENLDVQEQTNLYDGNGSISIDNGENMDHIHCDNFINDEHVLKERTEEYMTDLLNSCETLNKTENYQKTNTDISQSLQSKMLNGKESTSVDHKENCLGSNNIYVGNNTDQVIMEGLGSNVSIDSDKEGTAKQESIDIFLGVDHITENNDNDKKFDNRYGEDEPWCFKCFQFGHKNLNCSLTSLSCQNTHQIRCTNCNEIGHNFEECTKEDMRKCNNCFETGHMAQNSMWLKVDKSKTCSESKMSGHDALEYTSSDIQVCVYCNESGHASHSCENKMPTSELKEILNDSIDTKYQQALKGTNEVFCENAEEQNQTNLNDDNRSTFDFDRYVMKPIQCFYCLEFGHVANECTKSSLSQPLETGQIAEYLYKEHEVCQSIHNETYELRKPLSDLLKEYQEIRRESNNIAVRYRCCQEQTNLNDGDCSKNSESGQNMDYFDCDNSINDEHVLKERTEKYVTDLLNYCETLIKTENCQKTNTDISQSLKSEVLNGRNSTSVEYKKNCLGSDNIDVGSNADQAIMEGLGSIVSIDLDKEETTRQKTIIKENLDDCIDTKYPESLIGMNEIFYENGQEQDRTNLKDDIRYLMEPIRCFNCVELRHTTNECTKNNLFEPLETEHFVEYPYKEDVDNTPTYLEYLNTGHEDENREHLYCVNCQEYGHILDECFKDTKLCYNCFEFGHLAQNCSNDNILHNVTTDASNTEISNIDQSIKCFNCSRNGHLARNCTQDYKQLVSFATSRDTYTSVALNDKR